MNQIEFIPGQLVEFTIYQFISFEGEPKEKKLKARIIEVKKNQVKVRHENNKGKETKLVLPKESVHPLKY